MNNTVNTRPSIALFAYSQPGAACLKELIQIGANVSVVFTHIDSENEAIWFDSVYDLAKENNIPVYRSKKIDESAFAFFRQASPDIIISAYYRAIIPEEFLNVPKLGSYNLHGALLPKYRGRACINWAVLNGESQTGVTLHVMTSKADQGDIIAQEAFPIDTDDTAHDIFLKTSSAVRKIIKNYLPLIENGSAPHKEQDESQATKFGRRCPDDGIIDWNKDAFDIYNLIRAVTHPFPGAFTFYNGKKLFIWWAVPLSADEFYTRYYIQLAGHAQKYAAGTIINALNGIIIKCGKNYLLLKTISWDEGNDCRPSDAEFAAVFKTGSHFSLQQPISI